MATIPTQNAVPSEAPRDLKFNSGKIDEFVTSLEHEYKDRFGRCHMTIEGMRWIFEQLMERFKVDINQAIIAAGYVPMDSFQQGAEITKRNEILRDETTGEYYRWDGDLPKSVPAGATPVSSGGVGVGKWVGVGDASLRAELKSNTGAMMIGTVNGGTVQQELDKNNRRYLYAVDYLPAGYVTDGSVDYLTELQQALDDAAASGKVVIMPNFQILINPTDQFNNPGLSVPSNSYIIFQPDSSLKIKPNNFEQYGVLTLSDVSNVRIDNPVCYGDKYTHLGTLGEFGFGIFIRGNCDGIYINNVKCYEMWGDGIFIGPNWPNIESYPKNVHINGVVCDKNRRQGVSLTAGENILLENLVLSNTKSSDCQTPLPGGPHAGIDIEPDYYHTPLKNIIINNLSGESNDAGLFYVALNLANKNKPEGSPPYQCNILVNGISDKYSRGVIELWGMPSKNPDFSGYISIKNIYSESATGNSVRIHDWFESGHLPLLIDNINIFNWCNFPLSDQEKSPIALTVSESNTYPNSLYPQFGTVSIKNLSLISNQPPSDISDYVIYTTNNNGFYNVTIDIERVSAGKNLLTNIFGSVSFLARGFGYGCKKMISGNLSLNPAEICDHIASTKCIVNLGSFDERFIGQEYRFVIDTASGDEYIEFNKGGNNVFVNGNAISSSTFRFFNSSGVITMTVWRGFIYFKTTGQFSLA